MDPLTLATTVASFLSPYLVKAGEKAFETVGEKSVDSLWRTITAKFTGKPTAEEAVKDLVAKPDDQLIQSAFAHQLRKVLAAEPAFAAELERLLSSAQSEGSDAIVNTGSGAVATTGGVAAGESGVAIKGDVHGNIIAGGAKKKG
jgi:hypothetical protein